MSNYIFGPVPSRRLGISLGVDITPYKTCTLDCVYCECGKTTNLTLNRESFIAPEIILAELTTVLAGGKHIDYITFSGSGEPTLHSEIGTIIRSIKKMCAIPVAILTNGTLLYLPEVRRALAAADLVLPSLEAISPAVFTALNRPHPLLDNHIIIDGLIKFRQEFHGPIWLEVFLAKGINDAPEELAQLHDIIKKIDPEKVQLNSLDRPPAYDGVLPVEIKTLEHILEQWADLPVEIIKRIKKREDIPSFSVNFENSLLNTIKRRPLTIDDLEAVTGKHKLELFKYIDVLEKEKKIRPQIVGDKIFFSPI